MTPATVEDAYDLLLEAIAIDDPVIFCEHKFLYNRVKVEKLLERNGRSAGKARIARPGRDLTIVTYSATVHDALLAAQELARSGIQVEVVDLRTVKPLDTATVLTSIANTGRLLCVGESWPWGGVNAEVIARVASKGFHLLDSPPQRLNSRDVPIPYHPDLWRASRPSVATIIERVRKILQW
jgi:acetoin:2,6-dichlorophenolindophenol oxidoreductase subunit beta